MFRTSDHFEKLEARITAGKYGSTRKSQEGGKDQERNFPSV